MRTTRTLTPPTKTYSLYSDSDGPPPRRSWRPNFFATSSNPVLLNNPSLARRADDLARASLSSGVESSYATALYGKPNGFLAVTKARSPKKTPLLPATIELVTVWVSWISIWLTASTVHAYVKALKKFHQIHHYEWMPEPKDAFQLCELLAGMNNALNKGVKNAKCLVDYATLKACKPVLDLSKHNHRLLRAVLALLCCRGLRGGELVAPDTSKRISRERNQTSQRPSRHIRYHYWN